MNYNDTATQEITQYVIQISIALGSHYIRQWISQKNVNPYEVAIFPISTIILAYNVP